MAKQNDGCTNFYTCLLAIPGLGIGCLTFIFLIFLVVEFFKWLLSLIF